MTLSKKLATKVETKVEAAWTKIVLILFNHLMIMIMIDEQIKEHQIS